ncbi:MAG: extracellular solute-binding protein [Clostridiales bacterium]|nr:extracellular solute-binding protein [Clostridiales bacterium]
MKRIFALLLCITLISASFYGCGKKEEAPTNTKTETGSEVSSSTDSASNIGKFPISEEKITLDIIVTRGSQQPSWNDIYVWKKYEEMTNIYINWIEVSSSERSEKISTALASGDMPDVFLRCKVSASDLLLYGEQGLFVDLTENDMLQTYAPNYWNYLSKYADTRASVQYPSGAIYAFPQVNDGPELRVSRKVFFNKNWLDRLGLELPRTTEEFYNVLKAFKEQDANGNGDPNDEIPMSTGDFAAFQDSFLGAFGLSNRGQQNQIVDWDIENNKPRLIAGSDDYKNMLQFMNRLYTEGLIDQELFTMDGANFLTKAEDDRIGCFAFANLSSVPSDTTENWVGLEEALEGPDGHKLWAPVRAHFHSTGAAVISSTNEHLEETLQWLDYFWSDEGNLFYHYGDVGVTAVAKDDGSYDWTDEIYDKMTGSVTFDEVVSSYTPYVGGNNPVVEVWSYFGGGETQPIPAQTARNLFKYGTDVYWPSFTFTTEENDQLTPIQTDINKYIQSARTEFIIGTRSFDTWDSYLADLDKMGLSTMLEIYGAAIERFENMQ